MILSRRRLLATAAAALAAPHVMTSSRARAATSIVATTYPGSFDEAFRAVMGPAFQKASGADVTFTPLLGVDQIGKIQASRNAPPFDVVLFDESFAFQEARARWLYTGITRAAKRLSIVV